jgi:hypothetical protein
VCEKTEGEKVEGEAGDGFILEVAEEGGEDASNTLHMYAMRDPLFPDAQSPTHILLYFLFPLCSPPLSLLFPFLHLQSTHIK